MIEQHHSEKQSKFKIILLSLLYKVIHIFCFAIKWGLIPLVAIVLLIDVGTSYLVKDKIFTEIKKLPKREYAVVLGTAKFYPSGTPNLYYKYRLAAAKEIYLNKKADYFLMSGDNKTPYYNEPKMMSDDLRKMGVDRSIIQQDYAGLNTLDSIIRANKVFKLKPFIIVSQRFHCERALVIAKFHHIDAVCFVAKYPEKHYWVRIRESIARVAMVLGFLRGADASSLAESKVVKPTNSISTITK